MRSSRSTISLPSTGSTCEQQTQSKARLRAASPGSNCHARIKAIQPLVTNRQIARTLGVDHQTINKDAGDKSPRAGEKLNAPSAPAPSTGDKSPPPDFTGERAARRGVRRQARIASRNGPRWKRPSRSRSRSSSSSSAGGIRRCETLGILRVL
jgi:hypothetical protein